MSKNEHKQKHSYKNRKLQNIKYKDQKENSILIVFQFQFQFQRESSKAKKAIKNTATKASYSDSLWTL